MITVEQLARAIPCPIEIAEVWHPALVPAMHDWDISNSNRIAGFLAQIAHESANLSRFIENLNYSVQGLANTWPSRFAVDRRARPLVPNALAWRFGRTPSQPCDQRALANHVYGNRGGNRPGTDDGWLYRGRGPKQITFYDNYYACGLALGIDLVTYPGLLMEPVHGAMSAAWYWTSSGCNQMMDAGDFGATTLAINGGMIGHDERVEHYGRALRELGVPA